MTYFSIIVRLVLWEAAKSRLPWLLAAMLALAAGLALFLGQVAILETREIQSTLLAAMLRTTAVFLTATFVIASMVRESDDKVTEVVLAQPTSRTWYFFGKLVGFSALSVIISFVVAVPLAILAPGAGLLAWLISMACELILMSSLGLFCVLSLSQVLPALSAVAAFYLLSRSMTTVQLIAKDATESVPTLADQIVNWVINLIALFLPTLDRFTLSAWLVNAPHLTELQGVVIQSLVYTTLLSAAGLFDLHRRNF